VLNDDFTSGTSFVGQHPVFPRRALAIAPTDGSTTFNAIRIPLLPVACWRLNDPGFAFDSSFVAPDFQKEVDQLRSHLKTYEGCPAALFGHCDPAGSDQLNKTLGDRRAIAIYALLTRQPDMWAYLYDNPAVGDTWGMHAIQTMLTSVIGSSGSPYHPGPISGQNDSVTTEAIRAFQGDSGNTATGQADGNTRTALFGAYMDWLVSADPKTPSLMQITDFLGGQGAGRGDLPKMSLQGCSRFNPVVLLTASEMAEPDTTTRNADDAPNRRVIMFLFEKGTTVDASAWPCPEVKKSFDGCTAVFWPDGDQRRQNGDARRDYKDTRDTMACRFYDRFARRSTCEGKQDDAYLVRLHDNEVKPITSPVPYRVTIGSATPESSTSQDGWVKLRLPKDQCVERVHLEWGQPTSDGGAFPYSLDLVIDCDVGDDRPQSIAKLNNIGYSVQEDKDYDAAVRQFQADYGLSDRGCNADGTLPSATRDRLWSIYDEQCDASRHAGSA
jgi:peptidoglycan hydrolase-like protein with peptidoglycan-binding domain